MSNDVRNLIISKFINGVYNGETGVMEASFFLTRKLGLKSIEFTDDGQVIIVNKDNKVETYFYQGEIKKGMKR